MKINQTTYKTTLDRQATLRGTKVSAYTLKISQAVSKAADDAITDVENDNTMVRVISANTGTGKSSCSLAYGVALVTDHPTATALYVVEQIKLADAIYRELVALLPSDIPPAIWTSAHDPRSLQSTIEDKLDGKEPTATFTQEDLRNYRVAVVTHKLFQGPNARHALETEWGPRTLKIVDEAPELSTIIDIVPSDLLVLRDQIANVDLQDTRVSILTYSSQLLDGMWLKANTKRNYEPLAPISANDARPFLEASKGREAAWCEANGVDKHLMLNVCKFLVASSLGYCFAAHRQDTRQGSRFVGYLPSFQPTPGTLMLDATADISGFLPLLSYMEEAEVPPVSFRNLEVVMRKELLNTRFSAIKSSRATAKKYVDALKGVVLEETKPGEDVLVYAHKYLFDQDLLSYGTPDQPIYWEGRRVSLGHWGTGIGENKFARCTTVLLFGAFHRPRRVNTATTLGALQQQATDESLSGAAGGSLTGAHLTISDGHLLRHWKQIGMRGSARSINEDGSCGEMKLVICGDRDLLMKGFTQMFPGANPPKVVDSMAHDGEGPTVKTHGAKQRAIIQTLIDMAIGEEITGKEMGERIGLDWRSNGKRFLRDKRVQAVMDTMGVEYLSVKGRNGSSRFIKTNTKTLTKAA